MDWSVDPGKDKTVVEIVSCLKAAANCDGPVKVSGTWGSFAPMLTAHISKELKRPILYVSPHLDDADDANGDLQVFAGRPIENFPVWEGEHEFSDATDEIGAQRLRVALALGQGAKAGDDFSDLIITTSAQALNQPVPRPDMMEEEGLKLAVSQTIEPELVIEWLIDNGFEQVDSVDLPGQFAHRGGIVDIFAPVTAGGSAAFGSAGSSDVDPVRLEFFGDNIESIRKIDLDTQRSSHEIESICIIAAVDPSKFGQTELFINLLPKDTIIILEEPNDVEDVSCVFLDRVDDSRGLYPWSAVYKAMAKFVRLEISRFGGGGVNDINMDVTSAQEFEHKSGAVWKSNENVLSKLLPPSNKLDVLLYCENEAEIERVSEIVRESQGKVPDNFMLIAGFIKQGFIFNSLNTVVLSHHELFGQYAIRRRIRTIRTTSAVSSLVDLQRGDYVVHLSYGVGKFLGIKTMEKNNSVSEYLTVEYADKILIHVPVSNISLIQKYIGALPKRPKLSKIGTKKWENQKDKVAKGVQELAAELLEVQAKRENLGGYAFGADSTWQREFEESFLYQETPDQLTAIKEIKADMTEAVPMDRLLCGDVGYGKTEVAMRAAFKAIEAGKQVAVLVPTTVLCVQHGRTFAERFADFPITTEVLNRFVTGKRTREIISRARQGKVDVLIGTHRIISKDVGFKDLGLVIIDEEQRFGVEHKERLKKLRVNVDVLTMTATPIPRTLHLSLLGLRDISSLGTPPLDRRSIVTKVCRYEKKLIRKVIMHELSREGQIFFLHNRVQSIQRAADEIRKIVNDPKVRIAIAHGQMTKRELESAMVRFVVGQIDILVCSTIIESGLDIPNANTMIINDADRFGLAQLHQLRGRVGRYKHRAYAYMLLPADRPITPVAAKRLKAIEEYSQLGAGFRIALRDLEIRGAGNILGAEQSGHINTVGYEMYCRLLSEAVKRMKNEPIEKPTTALVDLGFSTYIPKSYIPSDRQRMDVYRRIAVASSGRDLERLSEELADLFGQVPKQVQVLLDLTELKVKASKCGIKSIVASEPDLVFVFENAEGTKDIFARAPGKVRIPDAKTVHIRLEKNYFEPMTLMSILRKMLSAGP
ncbi:MAG TPA: transcription-repair coupling factor [Phycisphaerales bacterium]|nr:transcription-repair coupling factor [Phycisphaerales bacterium]